MHIPKKSSQKNHHDYGRLEDRCEKKACRGYSELLVLPRADCFGGTGGALLSEPKLLFDMTESLR